MTLGTDVSAQGARGADPDTLIQFAALGALVAIGGPGTEPVPGGLRRAAMGIHTGRVTVVIPAHDEEASVGDTIRSLRRQSLRPAQFIVVCDNCTDDTAGAAAAAGARVLTTSGNTARKGGALNQAFDRVLPEMDADDFVLVMDADSRLSDNWVEAAVSVMLRRPEIAGVCGRYAGEGSAGLIGQLQRNEYARASQMNARRPETVWVLSGCGTMFRVAALRAVARERGVGRLAGIPGEYYSTLAITEDYEITLSLRTLGYACECVPACVAITELMPTWRHLFQQRVRWQKGTIRDLRRFGVTPVTRGHWFRQVISYLSYLVQFVCFAAIIASFTTGQGYSLAWGIPVLAITLAERLWTVRSVGWAGVGLAALVIPEFCYGLFKAVVMFWALGSELARRDVVWNHVAAGEF
jgi:poly-beta-1,6-N-acetyl-D-glucosamine synthase